MTEPTRTVGQPPAVSTVPYGLPSWQRVAAILVGLLAVWLFLRLFAGILLPFVVAAGIAYFLDPPVSKLARLGMPRWLGAILMLVALVTFILLSLLLLYPLASAQIRLLSSQVPQMVTGLQSFAVHEISALQKILGPGMISNKLQALVADEAGAAMGFIADTARRLLGTGFALFNILTLVIVTPIIGFYLLRDWPLAMARLDSLLPRAQEAVVRELANDISRILNAWLRGQAICCLFLAAFYSIALSAAGLNLGLVLGLVAGILSFIPYVGTIVGALSSIVLAIGQFNGIDHILIIGLIFVAGQLLNDYVVAPRFLGDRLGLSAVWVIFALFAGAETFGFLGILLAVPVTATLGVLARFWIRRYQQSSLYLDPPRVSL